jgi:hypothetical protein
VPDDAVVLVHCGVCAWSCAGIDGQNVKATNKARTAMGFVTEVAEMRILTSKK